jgi:drug/metabolite transporter superfamily protein YnfA
MHLCPCPHPTGTLMVFAVVALALIWKRVVKQNAPTSENAKPLALICLLTCACIGTYTIWLWCVRPQLVSSTGTVAVSRT